MKTKYNLALTPLSKNHEIITLSQKLSSMADRYILGEKSLPHVTLYHFEAEENEIEQIWERVLKIWTDQSVELKFGQVSCTTFDDIIFWVSLLPDNEEILHRMHGVIAEVLKLPVKKSFSPHMTLINSRDGGYEMAVAKLLDGHEWIVDKFILTLGWSDEVGQFTEVMNKVVE